MNKTTKTTQKKRVAVPKNLFLPKINHKRILHYSEQVTRKKTQRFLRYADYYIEEPASIEDIVELIESRPRFKELVKYAEKVIKTKGNPDFSAKFVINGQTVNDCRLAVLYLNNKLGKSEYFTNDLDKIFFDYKQTYEYHKRWQDEFYFCGPPSNDRDYDVDEDIAVIHAPPVKADDDTGREDRVPDWASGNFPMYVSVDNIMKCIEDEDFNDNTYPLIYVLDAREKPKQSAPMSFGMGMGLDMGDDDYESSRNSTEALAIAGYKTIYIPNAEKNELRNLFGNVSNRMGMRISKSMKFDALIEQYGNFLNTEHDLRGVIRAIKEHKIFEGTLDAPVSFKDFEAVCNPLKQAQLKHAESKKSKKDKTNPWDELNSLIGCDNIKHELRRMVDYLLLDKRRREYGVKSAELTRHSVFFGSPGTAKTTIARLASKILAHEGIISSENFKECRKSDVVGQYVGWTAAAVDSMFKKMSDDGGGVIFFDEAYTYAERDSTCFDVEAVNCIVQNLENYRNVMCIFAGYEEPMKRFVEANPGLRSRIGFTFKFDDYDATTTYKIAQHQSKALGFELPDSCERVMVKYFDDLIKSQGEHYGNGRCARLLIENAGLQLASRLAQQKRKPTKTECTRLTIEDIKNAIKASLQRENAFQHSTARQIGFRADFDTSAQT